MTDKKLSPRKALNKAFLKVKPIRESIEASDSNADITILETEIDRLVYQLYGLTEEEIKIVKGETN